MKLNELEPSNSFINISESDIDVQLRDKQKPHSPLESSDVIDDQEDYNDSRQVDLQWNAMENSATKKHNESHSLIVNDRRQASTPITRIES